MVKHFFQTHAHHHSFNVMVNESLVPENYYCLLSAINSTIAKENLTDPYLYEVSRLCILTEGNRLLYTRLGIWCLAKKSSSICKFKHFTSSIVG